MGGFDDEAWEASEECAAEYRWAWGQDDSDEGEGESIGNGAG